MTYRSRQSKQVFTEHRSETPWAKWALGWANEHGGGHGGWAKWAWGGQNACSSLHKQASAAPHPSSCLLLKVHTMAASRTVQPLTKCDIRQYEQVAASSSVGFASWPTIVHLLVIAFSISLRVITSCNVALERQWPCSHVQCGTASSPVTL